MTQKETIWPKEGKLKKVGIILAIVLAAAGLITVLEEKTSFRAGKKLPLIIALACTGVWFYQPAKKETL